MLSKRDWEIARRYYCDEIDICSIADEFNLTEAIVINIIDRLRWCFI